MSDWTPTTEQVRNGYRFDTEDYYHNPLQADANAERAGRYFDRWLEQVKAEAWDEGFDAGERDAFHLDTNPDHICIPNPYRKEQGA